MDKFKLDKSQVADCCEDQGYETEVTMQRPSSRQFLGLPILSWISLAIGGVCAAIVWF